MQPVGGGGRAFSRGGMGPCVRGPGRLVGARAGGGAGLVAADPFHRRHGDPSQRRDVVKRTELASVRKSLLNALIGIAMAEQKISLDSTLAQLGIDDNPPLLTEVEKQATVRMLL